MARLEELIEEIADQRLREQIAGEVAKMKAKKKFGLVFEEHLPEVAQLPGLAVKPGARVCRRGETNGRLFVVKAVVNGKRVRIVPERGGAEEVAAKADLLVVKRFGEPMYPALIPIDRVTRAPGKPYHTLINADNFHALQVLLYCYEGQVDVIYIDPPYNTGARDWKYNNDYVDKTDQYRHSKWLSMMKKRLLLAKRLLNPGNSVLIVTIDEKEYLRLGLLLKEEFPECKVQMVSTLINPANVARAGAFGRSDEYIFFVSMGAAAPQVVRLNREWVSDKGRTHTGNIRWDLLRRSGEGAARKDSPGCFYPIYIDPKGPRIAKVGEALPEGKSRPQQIDGCVAVLPMRKNGTEGRWQWTPATLIEREKQGRVRITGSKAKGFVVSILKDGEFGKIVRGEFQETGKNPDGSLIVEDVETETVLAVPGSQWRISSHDATQYGSRMLSEALLPGRKFPFPKSLYAVEDTIRFYVRNKPDALILDFFAGSGTTSHAVARLNREDGGRRQSISVTNNEVNEETARRLNENGIEAGQSEFEKNGICEAITWPRMKAALTGKRPGRSVAIPGEYLDGTPMADGFQENAQYLTLAFLDPAEVKRGESYEAILPILWMMAGASGDLELTRGGGKHHFPKGCPFCVLLQEAHFADFGARLAKRADITHVFLVTNSVETFHEMAERVGKGRRCIQLYKSYLDNFKINLEPKHAD